MAQADIKGLDGNFVITTATVCYLGANVWSASLDVDKVPIAPSFGEKWETASLGAGRVTGSVSGKLQYDATGTQPWEEGTGTDDWTTLKGAVTCTSTTGCTLAGNVVFTNITVTRPHTGPPTFSADWSNSDAAFAVTWDVGA